MKKLVSKVCNSDISGPSGKNKPTLVFIPHISIPSI